MFRNSLFYALARASCLAILLSLIVGDALYAQGNSGKGGGGGGNKGGGGSNDPGPQLPSYRFRVEKIDMEAVTAELGAVEVSLGARNSNLDTLGHATFADGSFEPYLNLYTEDGYQPHLLGPWPEEIFFYLDPNDPYFDPDANIGRPTIMKFTGDMVAVVSIWSWRMVLVECDGEEWEEGVARTDFVAVPIIGTDNSYSFGEPTLIGSRQSDAISFFHATANDYGDILYHSQWVIDPDNPCGYRQEAGIFLRNSLGGISEIDLIERLEGHGYNVDEIQFNISRLNSMLHVTGVLGSSVFHYDPAGDVLSTTEEILRNSNFLNISESGIVVGDKRGAHGGVIWDPITGQVLDVPLDLGSGANTTFVPLSVRDLDDVSGPSDVRVLGCIRNNTHDDRNHVPLYFEAGEAFFLQDLVTDDSPDSQWFRNLDPARLYHASGTISGDGQRMMFRASSLLFGDRSGPTVTDSSLVILHRVEEGGDNDGEPGELVASVSLVDVGPRGRHMDVIASVVNADGDPVSGALVEVAVVHSSGQVTRQSGTTGSDGTVRWSYSNANASDYTAEVLSASHPDYD